VRVSVCVVCVCVCVLSLVLDGVPHLLYGDFDCSTMFKKNVNGVDWSQCIKTASSYDSSKVLYGGTHGYVPFTYYSKVSIQQVIYEYVSKASNSTSLQSIIAHYRKNSMSISSYYQSLHTELFKSTLIPTAVDVFSLAIVFLLIIHRTSHFPHIKVAWCKHEIANCSQLGRNCTLAHVLLYHHDLSTVKNCYEIKTFLECSKRMHIPADILPSLSDWEMSTHAHALKRASSLDKVRPRITDSGDGCPGLWCVCMQGGYLSMNI
jgi:hypothetical protein